MKITKTGLIESGDYSGWSLIIGDDTDGIGGCYLFIKKDDQEGFDYWFENEALLNTQLSDFVVVWDEG